MESRESILVQTVNKTLNQWKQDFDPKIIKNTSNMTIDGQPAVLIDATEFGQSVVGTYYNGKLYIFNEVDNMPLAMLASFKFTK